MLGGTIRKEEGVKDWQFDVLFGVSILGAVVMLFSDPLKIDVNPAVVTIFGLMLAFVYQQKKSNDKDKKDNDDNEKDKEDKQ
jgi:hypothetical protein